MIPRTLVDATDLINWAARRDAQGLLPRLIRRLIHATIDRISRIGFPAGEGIQAGGWDGIIVVGDGNAFVPDGSSVWELSTNHDVRTKANSDYEKRRNDPRGVDPSQTTFIFVTPRRWAGKDEWKREKGAEGFWRDVSAYDADDIEQWLELAPAVHIWLSTLLGKHPEGVTDLETFWDDWSAMTRPAITGDLVLAGRGEIIEKAHEWLRNSSAPFTLYAESPEEALAIFAATLLNLPSENRVSYFASVVIVHDSTAWSRLVNSEKPLILIPTFDSRDLVARAARKNHRVILPLGRADSPSDTAITIPRLSSQEAAIALVASGISEDRANDLAILARRSFMSFRRKLAISPELQQPDWARPSEARPLLPAMFAGSWSDAVDGDCQALAKLAGAPYREVQQVLIRWANETDPPVRHLGDTWYINSKEDMWSLLKRYIVREDLDRFEEVVLDALSTIDPHFEQGENHRSMATGPFLVPKYSGLLQKGLADTLAVMGVWGEITSLSTGVSIRDYAIRIVSRLLERANTDWRIWASLQRALPLLAEAAPDAFLAAVETGLDGNEPVLLKLFTKEDRPFTSSPHIWLLWALETLAWSPGHLGRVALVLAKLTRLEPEGKRGNRPGNSLGEIFLLWHPQTAATFDQRLHTLDAIRKHEPEAAWKLFLQLRPVIYGVAHNTARPRWQEWVSEPLPQVSYGEIDQGVSELISRMLTDAGESGPRWKDLIEEIPSLPLDQYEAVTERLANIDVEHLRSSDREDIRDALRKLIAKHRSFPEADWALSRERVDDLDRIFRRFEPRELSARYRWLFDDNPDLPEGRNRDWNKRQEAIARARLDAARSLYDWGGVVSLIDFCRGIKRPGDLGITLGLSDLLEDKEDHLLRDFLASEEAAIAQFARGFSAGRIATRGREWGEEKLTRLVAVLRPLQRAEILICLPHDGNTWDLIEGSDSEIEHRYWSVISPYAISGPADLDRVVRKLLKHGRPHDAVDLIVYYGVDKNPSPKLILDVLSGIQYSTVKPPTALSLHNISELFDVLEKSSEIEETRIAALEWAFLPLLEQYDRSPRLLHRELARNPDFFAEIVALAYRSENEETHESTEEGRARALRAYELLDSWDTVPGPDHNGSIDADMLNNWVRRARVATSASGRGTTADRLIGKVLSYSPAGADGTWPHPAVRDLIEAVASTELERGFGIGVYNSRGVVTKKPNEGGGQGRLLAERYTGFAVAIGISSPRTAAMLRRIADDYHREARREDQDAELREDLG